MHKNSYPRQDAHRDNDNAKKDENKRRMKFLVHGPRRIGIVMAGGQSTRQESCRILPFQGGKTIYIHSGDYFGQHIDNFRMVIQCQVEILNYSLDSYLFVLDLLGSSMYVHGYDRIPW